MKIAKFWARERGLGAKPDGSEYELVSWAGSNVSIEQAKNLAIEKLRGWQASLRTGQTMGGYPYADIDQIREELIAEHHDESGTLVAAVTRNRYGALVLNTSNVLFADVDLPDSVLHYREPGALGRFISRLFGKKPEHQTKAAVWAKTREKLRGDFIEFQRRHPTLSVRVYETSGGFRLAITNEVFAPTSDIAKSHLNELGSDPLYMRLCASQECFRARLSPKPWRCQSPNPPGRFPREAAEMQNRFNRWLTEYELASNQFGVCRVVDSLGGVASHPIVTRVLDLHDRYCVKDPALKLA